jgi:simple sugar transport system permease protein
MIIIITAIISFIMILSVAAVGGHFSERAGIVNLSIEAFMTIGAIVYSLIVGNKSFVGDLYNQF